MRRLAVLICLVTVGAVSVGVSAVQQTTNQPRRVEAEKLRDNVFVLTGGGGNTTVFVGSTGVVVVDTKNPGWGQPILDKIKELTNKPVTTIINTHTHFDHVSGNLEFPANVEIVAHENTKANMVHMREPSGSTQNRANVFAQSNGKGMPTKTFKDTMSMGAGSDRIDLYYFGRGHTSGDAWVSFPSVRVVAAGDIFSGKNIPLLDANNGGSGVNIGDTLAKAADALEDVESIVTGHSTVMAVSDLREYAQFNRDFLAAMREAKRAGRSVDDVAKSWTIPAKYAGYAAPQPARLRSNVQVVFDELR